MLRSVAVTAWLAATCGFEINQIGSDLRTVVVGFWVSKRFWRLKKCGFLFGFFLSSHIRCFWVLNFLGFVLVCSSSVFLSFSFFDTLSLCKLFVGVSMVDLKLTFLKVYSVLKSELLEDSAFEWTDDSCQWVELVHFLSISYSYIVSHLLSHHSSSSFCSFIFDKVSHFLLENKKSQKINQ